MTETDAMVTGQASTSPHLTEAAARRRAARQRGELIFRSLGLAALGLAALFLVALMYSVFKKSYNGFVQSFITLEIPLDAEILDPEDLAQYQASVGIAPELWAAEITPTTRGAKSASRKVQRTAAYKKMVEAMIDQVGALEGETDRLGVAASRELFKLEETLPPVSVVFWYQLIEWVGNLADNAEKVANRLRLLIAR